MLPKYGDWQVVRELGRGSFGQVYEIQKEEFGQTYRAALKIISIPKSPSDVDAVRGAGMTDDNITEYYHSIVEDSVKEIALMSELQGNSNIVNYQNHEVRKHPDDPGWDIYLQMELLMPLNKYIQQNGITREEVIRLGMDVCSALEVCQERDIIHRDIKPENIFLSKQGHFKLGDFGIARTEERTKSGMSRKGTYSYMAPEVYRGEAYNKSVDLYSLGMVLYRLLNENRAPFMPPYPQAIRYEDQEQALMRRMSGEPLPMPSREQGDLAEIVLKACSFNPQNRFASPAAMRQALDTVLHGGQVQLEPDLPPRSWVSTGDETDTAIDGVGNGGWPIEDPPVYPVTLAYEEMQTRRKGGLRWMRWAAVVLASLLVVGGGAFAAAYGTMTSEVPNLVGKSQEDAIAALEDAGFHYTVEEDYSGVDSPGKVLSQSPEAEKRAWKRNPVALNVSMQENQVSVPDVLGMDAEKAAAAMTAKGLKVSLKGKEDSSAKKGTVLSQSLAGGKTAERGKEITLTVCTGAGTLVMPNIVDLETEQAKKVLKNAGFSNISKENGYNPYIVKGRIFDQKPKTGACIKADAQITLYESLGADPKGSVPDVVGLDAEKAVSIMQKCGYQTTLKGKKDDDFQAGTIMKQSVDGGKQAQKGTKIELTVCLGTDKLIVPYVIGMTEGEAKAELKSAGFENIKVGESDYCADVEKGCVFQQSQDGGTLLMPKTAITICISKGYEEGDTTEPEPEPEPGNDSEPEEPVTPEPSDPEQTELSDMINDVELFQETVGGESSTDENYDDRTRYETFDPDDMDEDSTDEDSTYEDSTDEDSTDGDQITALDEAVHFNAGERYLMRYYVSNPGVGAFEEETESHISNIFCRDENYSLYGCYVGQSKEEAKAILEEKGWYLFGNQWPTEESDDEEMYDEDSAICQNDAHEEMEFRFDEDGVITEISWNWNQEDYY